MTRWELLKLLDFKQFKSLFFIFIKHPLFVYPVLKASAQSMSIAQKEFPNIHGGNNKANAFRHALWNILLVKELFKWNKNSKKVIAFTKLITNWHEEFSPNKLLEKIMDLHNNNVGQKMALSLLKENENTIVKTLHTKLKKSVQFFSEEDTLALQNELIYLKE